MMTSRSRSSFPTSHQRGLTAEGQARTHLETKNYFVVAHRYRCKGGEIDLVVKRGEHIAFVEVKGRKSHDEALYAISKLQQARIAMAAEIFLSEHSEFAGCTASFDVVSVTPKSGVAHLENAFLA